MHTANAMPVKNSNGSISIRSVCVCFVAVVIGSLCHGFKPEKINTKNRFELLMKLAKCLL